MGKEISPFWVKERQETDKGYRILQACDWAYITKTFNSNSTELWKIILGIKFGRGCSKIVSSDKNSNIIFEENFSN